MLIYIFFFPGIGFIDNLEKEIKKPVITSNQAVIWYSLKMCTNITESDLDMVKGYGQLFNKKKVESR